MDWFPALTTTSLFGFALWLARNWIATRLTNAIRHEYNTKIEQLRSELRAKESQIEALRTGALSGLANRQAAIFERRLSAIEQLWESVISLGTAKGVAAWMAVVKFDAAAKEAERNPQFREIFAIIGKIDLNALKMSEAQKARPFILSISWAYYSAYQAILLHAVARMHMLQNGINMPEIIDTENATKLVKLALPYQVEYIEKYGPSAFYYLLEELESKLLLSFQLMLEGKESDQETLERAEAIIKQSEALMNSDTKAAVGE